MHLLAPAITLLYSELVQQLHLPRERVGSLYVRRKGDAEYLYLKSPSGRTRQDIFLGRTDDEAVQTRASGIGAEKRRANDRRALIAGLRAAGILAPSPDLGNVLEVLEHSGLWCHVVVVGTAAYQCYSAVVGALLPDQTLTTQDADIATPSLKLASDVEGERFEAILKRADPTFSSIPTLRPGAFPSHFRSASGFVVDLLTPQRRRSDSNPMPLPALQAGATPLQHLAWLIEEPIKAAALHGSGVAFMAPSPARYAVHKLIVAQNRGADRQKRTKDLQQAKALLEALLQTDRYALADCYEDAAGRGKRGWREPLEKSLSEIGFTTADLLP